MTTTTHHLNVDELLAWLDEELAGIEKPAKVFATYADEYVCEECSRSFDCVEAAEVHDNRHHMGVRTAAR